MCSIDSFAFIYLARNEIQRKCCHSSNPYQIEFIGLLATPERYYAHKGQERRDILPREFLGTEEEINSWS